MRLLFLLLLLALMALTAAQPRPWPYGRGISRDRFLGIMSDDNDLGVCCCAFLTPDRAFVSSTYVPLQFEINDCFSTCNRERDFTEPRVLLQECYRFL